MQRSIVLLSNTGNASARAKNRRNYKASKQIDNKLEITIHS